MKHIYSIRFYILFSLLFMLSFVVGYDQYSQKKFQTQTEYFSTFLSSPLWSIDRDLLNEYTSLILNSQDLSSVEIVNDLGKVVIKKTAADDDTKVRESWWKRNLAGEALVIKPIYFDNQVIGKIAVIWKKTNLAVYLSVFIILTLVQSVIFLYFYFAQKERALLLNTKIQQQAILDNTPYLAWLKNRQGKYLEVNQPFLNFVGKSRDEVIGKCDGEVFDADQATRMETEDQSVFEHKLKLFLETVFPGATEDKNVYYEVFKTPVTNAEGKVIGLSGLARNITQQKMMEKEKGHLQQQVIHKDKLASIGVLAAGVAHEINNPLTIILGFNDMISKFLLQGDVDKCLMLFKKQDESVRRIADIVSRLRTFARVDTAKVDKIDTHDSINNAISLMQPIYSKEGILLSASLNAPSFWIRGTQGKMQQIIINILNNAKDALLLANKAEKKIQIETENRTHYMVIKISDNGSGIPKNHLSKIFDPFFTTKAPNQGTGLGLSITLSLVHEMNGSIEVVSEEGEGSTFLIKIPCVAEKKEATTITPVQETKLADQQVLVVDDEPDIREIVSEIVSYLGCEVKTVNDGQLGFDTIKQESFDFIITDLQMPNMDGEAMLLNLEKENLLKPNKYIIITGGILNKMSSELQRLINTYKIRIITKPFTEKDIRTTLTEYMNANRDRKFAA